MPRSTSRLAITGQPRPSRPTQIDDPHLAALLIYIGGLDFSDNHEDELAAAQSTARTIVASKPLATAFRQFLNRPDLFGSVMDNRQTICEERLQNADDDRTRKELREESRLLKAIRANDDKTVEAISGDLFDVLVAFNMDSVLIGAAVMYELLQGGRR